jgi:hypothetical protein
VASIFTSYLAYWMLTMDPRMELTPPQAFEQARGRLEAMRPSLRAFWRNYAATRGLGPAAQPYLDRCLWFCAARLVVAVFEYLYAAAAMTAATLAMLQLAQNILLDPRRAAAELFGV